MRSRTLIFFTLAFAGLAVLPATSWGSGSGPEHRSFRDIVLTAPPAEAGRKVMRASAGRYPVHDGAGRTVEIRVTTACEIACLEADPQTLADQLGRLIHGAEISSLSVLVARKEEMNTLCGGQLAVACYYSDRNQMVIPGDDFKLSDGADRAFVIAHEYGHHIANHRRNPPFFPTVFHGTKRWVTHERVCQGTRAGRYFPGNQGNRYYDNPGEAFAEAYAFGQFPAGMVEWNWDETLLPDDGAYAAIRADVTRPWRRRARLVRTGAVGVRRQAATRRLATPLDGDVSLRLRGEPGAQLDLIVRNGRGRLLATATTFGANERVRIPVCGQRALRLTIRRTARQAGGRFSLIVRRP